MMAQQLFTINDIPPNTISPEDLEEFSRFSLDFENHYQKAEKEEEELVELDSDDESIFSSISWPASEQENEDRDEMSLYSAPLNSSLDTSSGYYSTDTALTYPSPGLDYGVRTFPTEAHEVLEVQFERANNNSNSAQTDDEMNEIGRIGDGSDIDNDLEVIVWSQMNIFEYFYLKRLKRDFPDDAGLTFIIPQFEPSREAELSALAVFGPSSEYRWIE